MDAFLYRIKAAQRDLIARCGGIIRVAELVSASKSEVGRWNNGADPDVMPVGAIVVLERDCGYALVTNVLAEANGRRLTDPEEERQAGQGILTALSEIHRQTGELTNAVGSAISDGIVTSTEGTTIDRIAASLEIATSNLRAAAAVIKAQGGAKAGLRVVGEG
ncbi:hypothetical protein [Rhizobium sp. BK602]|uniref:hypothetical protein n=1 Tax=Rhizobium sp. BK602 TaxID=2586986 RepID=UPI0018580C44|nr:hypothetical protein [Rhizobium sp. BK602]MBB3608640.1 hypothetical protein [Rhizobium sp. BK602]